jgi:hypothetical protein
MYRPDIAGSMVATTEALRAFDGERAQRFRHFEEQKRDEANFAS